MIGLPRERTTARSIGVLELAHVAGPVVGRPGVWIASSLMVVGIAPGAWRYFTRKCSTRSGMSSLRSRSGGMWMWITFSR